VHREQWLHTQGCRRWFMATRDTVSYQIQGYDTFKMGNTSADAQGGNKQ
jgi:sarcosine oxidase subunit delta